MLKLTSEDVGFPILFSEISFILFCFYKVVIVEEFAVDGPHVGKYQNTEYANEIAEFEFVFDVE